MGLGWVCLCFPAFESLHVHRSLSTSLKKRIFLGFGCCDDQIRMLACVALAACRAASCVGQCPHMQTPTPCCVASGTRARVGHGSSAPRRSTPPWCGCSRPPTLAPAALKASSHCDQCSYHLDCLMCGVDFSKQGRRTIDSLRRFLTNSRFCAASDDSYAPRTTVSCRAALMPAQRQPGLPSDCLARAEV